MSASTGVKPTCLIAASVATYVCPTVIISEFFFIPAHVRAKSNASVQLFTETTYLIFNNSEIFFSNFKTSSRNTKSPLVIIFLKFER